MILTPKNKHATRSAESVHVMQEGAYGLVWPTTIICRPDNCTGTYIMAEGSELHAKHSAGGREMKY